MHSQTLKNPHQVLTFYMIWYFCIHIFFWSRKAFNDSKHCRHPAHRCQTRSTPRNTWTSTLRGWTPLCTTTSGTRTPRPSSTTSMGRRRKWSLTYISTILSNERVLWQKIWGGCLCSASQVLQGLIVRDYQPMIIFDKAMANFCIFWEDRWFENIVNSERFTVGIWIARCGCC